MVLRDASLANYIVPLTRLQDFRVLGPHVFLGYKMGQSAVGYLVETYGRDKVGQIMHELRHIRTKDIDIAFKNVLGIGLEEFDKSWRRVVQKKYWPLVEHKDTPDTIAKSLTEKSRYSSNVKPAWSPSGDIIAYITGSDGFGEIVLVSAKSGKRLARISKRFFGSKYEDLRMDGSGIAWSPDGDCIACIAKHHGTDYLLEIDIITKKLKRRLKLDFDAAYSPSYDGNGDRMVFAALDKGQSDLYVIELLTGEITRLTNDPFDDNHPSWHPTTEEIIYSSERESKNKLVIFDVSNRSQRQLTYGEHNAVSPKWSPDGEKIIFCSELHGVYDLHTIKPDGADFTRLTSIITGCFNPSLDPHQKNIVFTAYQNGRQDIYLMDAAKAMDDKIDMPPLEVQPIIADASTPPPRRIGRRKYDTNIALDAIFTNFNLGADRSSAEHDGVHRERYDG